MNSREKPKVFLVFPDLGGAKAEALCMLKRRGVNVNVLISYATLRYKPTTFGKLVKLKQNNCLGEIMLDSAAYHVAFRGLKLSPEEYAEQAKKLSEIVDIIVGPDIPRNPEQTLERLLKFSEIYGEQFIPTIQSKGPSREYVESLRLLEKHGIIKHAPYINGKPLIGVGGLVGKKVKEVAEIVKTISLNCKCYLHLFGVNLRAIRGLARRSLLEHIYSIDTSGWLSEIKWRRRTTYSAKSTLEANYLAIMGYIEKLKLAQIPFNNENPFL